MVTDRFKGMIVSGGGKQSYWTEGEGALVVVGEAGVRKKRESGVAAD